MLLYTSADKELLGCSNPCSAKLNFLQYFIFSLFVYDEAPDLVQTINKETRNQTLIVLIEMYLPLLLERKSK